MRLLFVALLLLSFHAQAHAHEETPIEDDFFFNDPTPPKEPIQCKPANQTQTDEVTAGALKVTQFLDYCLNEVEAVGAGRWCFDIIRPNWQNEEAFQCTYGTEQPYILIHPDETTWKFAVDAIKLVNEIETAGICVLEIYNWWRPEPYNRTVEGAPLRHPGGTSVDVRLCTKEDEDRAHTLMCAARRAGKLRALGYYLKNALHLGVGDTRGNTWGKVCR